MNNESLNKDVLEKIEEAFRIRDFNAAIEMCQEALKNDPANEEIKKKLQRAMELQEAEPFLQSFISTGQTLLESGLCVDAVKQFEKVKVIDPTYPGVEDLIVQAKAAIHGDMFSSQASTQPAGADYTEPGTATPTDEKVQSIIHDGERFFMMGNYQQAIDAWSEVFMYDITNKPAHDLIEKARNELIIIKGQVQKYLEEARRFYEEKNFEAAEKTVRKAMELDETNEEARQLFSVISSRTGGKPEEDLGSQAEQAYQGKDWKRALEYYQKLVEVQPDHPLAANRISECKSLIQKKDQASKLISDAQVFHMQGKKDSALFALQKALEIDPNNKEAEVFLSTIQSATVTAASGQPMTIAEARRAASKTSRLLPVVIIMVILAIAGAYYVFFRKVTPPPVLLPRTKPLIPKFIPHDDTQKPTQPGQTGLVAPVVTEEKLLAILDEAHSYYMGGNLPEALKLYKQVLELSPNNPDAQSRIKEIESTLHAIAEQKDKYLKEATKNYCTSDFEAVVRILKVANEKFPKDRTFLSLLKDGYYNLGVSSLQRKQCDFAKEYLKQIQFLDPDDNSASIELQLADSCSGKISIEPSILAKIEKLAIRPFAFPHTCRTI